MAILNPSHLFEQANRLTEPPLAGPPRQVDLRRAVSAAYYGLFHAILAALADELVGVTKRNTPAYWLVYRSVDHGALRDLCNTVKKPTLPPKFRRFEPNNGFGPNIVAFASAFAELQEKRHLADYDPSSRFRTSDAQLAIKTAESALLRFEKAPAFRRKAFLTLLAFPPR